MNVKFVIAMLYSGVFLLFSGAFGTIWAGSIIGDFLVGAAQLNNAHLNISTVHVAHEGGFDLSEYPSIQQWIEKIQSNPKYIGME